MTCHPIAWLAAAALCAGCAGPRGPGAPAAPAVPAADAAPGEIGEPPLQQFERAQLARAEAAESRGRLAEAALAFEVLTLLQPDDPGYAQRLGEVRRRADAAAAEKLPRAAEALRRGDLEQAAQLYLEVLAIAPGQTEAAQALRTIERERNRRNFIGKPSRQTLTRRAIAEGEMSLGDDPAPIAARNQIEHATLLARNGDLDAAIALLRDGLRTHGDAAAKSVLADLYVQRAEAQRQRDPQAARASVNAALTIDPAHAGAQALARRLGPASRAPAPAAPRPQ